MARWLGHGNPAITEALNDVCQLIDREIRAELRQGKPLHKDASTSTAADDLLEDPSPSTHHLEEENARLHSELAAALDALRSEDQAELARLKCRFVALDNNFKKARKALEKKRDELDAWARHVAWLMRKIRAAEDQHGIQILERRHSHPPSPQTVDARPASDHDMPDLPPLPPTLSGAGDRKGTLEESDLLQSTQGDPDEDEEEEELPPLPDGTRHAQVVIKEEPSSDTPVVVWERSLKRRKVTTGVMQSIELPFVKDEPSGSSPVLRPTQTQESLDLDHIAQRMTTPRKRKELDDARRHSSPDHNSPSRAPTPPPACPERPPTSTSNAVGGAWSVLTPVSGNERSRRFLEGADVTPTVKDRLSRGIGELAEDGGAYGRRSSEAAQRSAHALGAAAHGRLQRLLSDHPDTPKSAGSPKLPVTPESQLGIPKRRELPFDQAAKPSKSHDGTGTPSSTTARLARGSDPRTPVRVASPQTGKPKPGASALRQRPLAELGLDDFKINPAANQGYDFAFSEVVRSKDDRAALRGCVEMHCCGKQWRAMALSQRPDPPLTAAQRQEEQKLLEEYLGDFAHKLASMTKDERAEMWLEAKTAELADKYGKHRHAFARRPSPPGFWNADFPDTQQLAAEREEASRRERQTVAERHREALRPGGRWLFRDE